MKLIKQILAMGLLDLALSQPALANVSGTVYEDLPMTATTLNTYGVKQANELGIAGVTVTVFGTGGGTTTTAADGTWSLPTATGSLRVEFSDWPTYFQASPDAGNANTSTQFVNDGDTVNFGLHVPNDYNDQIDPPLMISTFPSGDPLASPAGTTATHPAIFQIDNSRVGDATQGSANAAAVVSTAANVGTTWGLAWNNESQALYASAMVRRYAGLGPLGEGGIYFIDMSSGSAVVSNWLDVTTLGLPVGTVGTGATVELRNASRGLGADETSISTDAAGYPAVGKTGLGDIELSGDLTSLFVTNLNDQTVSEIRISDKTLVGTYNFPANLCTNGALRPFALKYYRGSLYAGAICDAETGSNADLSAHVFQLNTGGFTSVFTASLAYAKEYTWSPATGAGCTNFPGWFPWSDSTQASCNGPNNFTHPMPLLSDIEFDTDGSMILAFADRFGLQMGWGNGSLTNAAANWRAVTGGDLLRVYNNAGAYELESNATAGPNTTAGAGKGFGPNGGEYYFDDIFGVAHLETTLGGLAFLRGSSEVTLTAMDPKGTTFAVGGIHRFNNESGVASNGVYLYEQNAGGWGKSAGLGDVEYVTTTPPLEIGNLVWDDTDNDGIQDPDEAGIAGVTIELVLASSVIATATTNASGHYIFSNDPNGVSTASHIYNIANFTPNANYIVRIANTDGASKQAALGLNELTVANVGEGSQPDINDSDGIASGNNAEAPVAAIDIPVSGANNHSYDFGFRNTPSVTFCAGNLLLNGSFELPGSNTQDLDIWLDNVEATNSAGLTPKPDGLFYAVQNAGQPFIQDVAITGTNTYTLTFHAGSHDPATENNVVHLQYLDASDTLISEVTHTISHDVDAASPPQTLSPQRTLSLGESPANAAKVRVSIETLAGFSKIDAMCLLATTSVPSQTELSINKTVNVASATSGQTIVYTISVDNSSSVDATGVVLVDPLPSAVTYVSDDGGATTSESNGTVTWNVNNVNANSSATLNITVMVN